MNKEELLEKDPKELSEEELSRYNKLKKREMRGKVQEHKLERSKEDKEALDIIADEVKDQNIKEVDVMGATLEVDIDFDEKILDKIKKLKKYRNRDDLGSKESKEIKELVFEILGELCINYSKSDWKEKFGDKGITTLSAISVNVFNQVKEYADEIKKKAES